MCQQKTTKLPTAAEFEQLSFNKNVFLIVLSHANKTKTKLIIGWNSSTSRKAAGVDPAAVIKSQVFVWKPNWPHETLTVLQSCRSHSIPVTPELKIRLASDSGKSPRCLQKRLFIYNIYFFLLESTDKTNSRVRAVLETTSSCQIDISAIWHLRHSHITLQYLSSLPSDLKMHKLLT